MSNVIIYPESLCASVIGKELSAKTPTELYVAVMTEILKNRPQIIGQKETHFTADPVRAGQYTGTTREVYINNTKVYIKTGFSTKDKWKGIEKICQLVGLTFEVSYEEPSESVGDIFGFDDDFFADFGVSPNTFQETSSTEPFVPTSPFAFHSEYYIDKSDDVINKCIKFEEIANCDRRIYATGDFFFYGKFMDYNTVFEILPDDWSVRAIVSKDKYFTGDIAVNRNGIFRIDGNKFYLFDMNGNMKSKVAIKPTQPFGMYIYDSKIYSISAKGKVYEYDILNPASERVIWNISDIRGRLDDAVASYLLDNNLECRYNNQRIQFSMPYLTPLRICANDKRIIVGFELTLKSKQISIQTYNNIFMFYVSIDTKDYSYRIIDISDERAEYKVFSFDMEKDIMWWWTGDNKSKHLFSTEIKPLDSAVKRNPQYSYHLSAYFNGGYSSLSSLQYLYFDGKSASGNDYMHTVFLSSDGTSEDYYDTYQCKQRYVLGDFMYRPNMCGGFVPHSKEAFVNYSSWHKITSEEFERAYQKAIGK